MKPNTCNGYKFIANRYDKKTNRLNSKFLTKLIIELTNKYYLRSYI